MHRKEEGVIILDYSLLNSTRLSPIQIQIEKSDRRPCLVLRPLCICKDYEYLEFNAYLA